MSALFHMLGNNVIINTENTIANHTGIEWLAIL